MNSESRFLTKVKVDTDTGCWMWQGFIDDQGYGRFRSPGEIRAHRFAFTHWNGPIHEGKMVDHLCRRRSCVNPEHLRLATSRENTFARGSEAPAKRLAEQTHCKHGHEFTPENTMLVNGGRSRACRTCHHARARARYERSRSTTCPEGHKKHPRSDGAMYCPTCQSAKRRRPSAPPPLTFRCGHLRAEGLTDRNGRIYCGVCRVERRTPTECRRGHPLTEENVYISPLGRRQCRACNRLREGQRGRSTSVTTAL